MEKYPSWLKGLPWKGSRSLIAARGFKSLLLRLRNFSKKAFLKRFKKLLTNIKTYDMICKLSQENDNGQQKKLLKIKEKSY